MQCMMPLLLVIPDAPKFMKSEGNDFSGLECGKMSNIGLKLALLVEKQNKECHIQLVIYDLACMMSHLTH